MFKEVTNLQDILVYGEAGLLWDSWFIREADTTNPNFGVMVWDMIQPIEARHWDVAQYETHDPEWISRYKFYINLEE